MGPSVLTSTKRYRVCVPTVSKTPLRVGVVRKEEFAFCRRRVSRMGLMYSDLKVLSFVNAPCSCPI